MCTHVLGIVKPILDHQVAFRLPGVINEDRLWSKPINQMNITLLSCNVLVMLGIVKPILDHHIAFKLP
jgi:hypothetical protein